MSEINPEEKFFEQNFDFISEFLSKLDLIQLKKLAELLFSYYQVHENLKPFFTWSIEKEVKNTSKFPFLHLSN